MFEEYHDDFADEDLSKLTLANQETINAFDKKIAENSDPRSKVTGDRVLVWDSSRLKYADDDRDVTHRIEELILANYESIVIEDGCKFTAKVVTIAGDFSKNLDLKVWNKNLNKVYRTSSEFVKRIG